ncbi:MAG: TetR/AcrR family transcriptional regulator [Saprospiraceae bacterium]|nr:TetR/AcrR family transcriptional regulator [Saprospiraceae bacterium]
MEEGVSTEEKIKRAAEHFFLLRGLEGARMQEIADEAGINKAMLHYYFRNKETLFDVILSEKLFEVFGAFQIWFQTELPLSVRVRQFVNAEIDIISTFPVLPLFVLTEARKNPEMIPQKLGHLPIASLKNSFEKMLEEEAARGNMRKTTPEELLVNTVSLCIYPIIASPVFRFILDLSDERYTSFIHERKIMIADWMIREYQIIN